eukprot:COSAG02_NODE_6_length_64796_cov_76.792865_33_plen_75_part_00
MIQFFACKWSLHRQLCCLAGCAVFGRDEAGGNFSFTQQHVDMLYVVHCSSVAHSDCDCCSFCGLVTLSRADVAG